MRTRKMLRVGKSHHHDGDFEGIRLVDNLTLLEKPKKYQKKVLVYSPYLRANILVRRGELK